MRVVELIKKSFNFLTTHKLTEFIIVCFKNIFYLFTFDGRFGTDTGGVISAAELGIEKEPNDPFYHATSMLSFCRIMRHIPIKHNDFVFIDFGAGKGRALLLASSYNFKKIIGIEISPTLYQIAKKNIAIYKNKRQKCHNIEVIESDAAEYRLPKEKSVLYLYHPFGKKTVKKVLSNIEMSLEENPREIFIVYLGPVHRHLFDNSPYLKLVSSERLSWRNIAQRKFAIYRSV